MLYFSNVLLRIFFFTFVSCAWFCAFTFFHSLVEANINFIFNRIIYLCTKYGNTPLQICKIIDTYVPISSLYSSLSSFSSFFSLLLLQVAHVLQTAHQLHCRRYLHPRTLQVPQREWRKKWPRQQTTSFCHMWVQSSKKNWYLKIGDKSNDFFWGEWLPIHRVTASKFRHSIVSYVHFESD